MFKEFLINKIAEVEHFIVVSLFFATVHTLFSPKNRNFFAYLLAFFISVPVGTFSGILAVEAELEPHMVYLIVSGSALLCQDIIKFVLSFTGYLNEYSETIFSYLVRKTLGNKIPLDSSEEETRNNDKDDNSN